MKLRLFILLILSVTYGFATYSQETDNENYINIENRHEKLIDLAKQYIETNPEYAINCARKSIQIAEQNNNIKEIAESKIVMGDIYFKNRFYSHAINNYENAIQDLLIVKDYKKIINAYTNLAIIYQTNRLNERLSVEAMNNASFYASMLKDKTKILETNLILGDIYLYQNQYHEAIKYYDSIINNEVNDTTSSTIIKAILGKSYIKAKTGNYDEALSLIETTMPIDKSKISQSILIKKHGLQAEIYDSIRIADSAEYHYKKAIELSYKNNYQKEYSEYICALGTLYLKNNETDSALHIYDLLSEERTNTVKTRKSISYYKTLSDYYFKNNNTDLAYRYLKKYDEERTDLEKEEQLRREKFSRKAHTLANETDKSRIDEKSNIEEKDNRRRTIRIILLLIFSLPMCVLCMILMLKNKELQKKNLEKEQKLQIELEEMENNLMDMQIRNYQESLVNMALNYKSYIEQNNSLKKELKNIINSPENEQNEKIKKLYSEIQNKVARPNTSENIYSQINTIYKDFIERLEEKYPNITKSEKKLCAMLYTNMSSKDIAMITNTTIRSVETSRYRLRKKFNLSRDEDIVCHLKTI